MEIPPSTHPMWRAVLLGEKKVELEFLGAKMLLTRAQMQLRNDSSPIEVTKIAHEFRNIFSKNAGIPKIQRDLERIFG
jgi:hypothetical protein